MLLLGGDTHLWAYPGVWSNPWLAKEQTHALRAVGAARNAAYGVLSDGRVARFTGGWAPIEGSAAWAASEIAVTDDEHLLVIAAGKLRAYDHGELKQLGCDAIDVVAVAATHGEGAFVLDGAGALFFNGDGHCNPISAPKRLKRIAATAERLLAVDVDGAVWRRRENAWTRLPAPFNCRAGQAPESKPVLDVAVSAFSTWLTDSDGSVFILSDET